MPDMLSVQAYSSTSEDLHIELHKDDSFPLQSNAYLQGWKKSFGLGICKPGRAASRELHFQMKMVMDGNEIGPDHLNEWRGVRRKEHSIVQYNQLHVEGNNLVFHRQASHQDLCDSSSADGRTSYTCILQAVTFL